MTAKLRKAAQKCQNCSEGSVILRHRSKIAPDKHLFPWIVERPGQPMSMLEIMRSPQTWPGFLPVTSEKASVCCTIVAISFRGGSYAICDQRCLVPLGHADSFAVVKHASRTQRAFGAITGTSQFFAWRGTLSGYIMLSCCVGK